MSVGYTKEQKAVAKDRGLHLVTMAAFGMEFQGVTTEEEARALLQYILEFIGRRTPPAK